MAGFRDFLKLPAQVWVLCACTLVNRMGTMALAYLVLYLTQGLHLSTEKAGFLMGCYGVGALLVAPIGGMCADKYGSTLVMLASLIGSGVVLCSYPWVQEPTLLIVFTVLWALTSEVFRPASLVRISECATENRKLAIALLRFSINAGASVGPLLGSIIVKYSFPWIFWLDGITSVAAGCVLWKYSDRILKPISTEAAPPLSIWKGMLGTLRDRKFILFLGLLIPVEMVLFQHESTLPLYLTQTLGISESVYGLMFAVNGVLIILCEIPIVLMTARWPHRWSLSLGCAFFGIGFGALLYIQGAPAFLLSVAIWTVGEMLLFPTSSAVVSELARKGQEGSYMGIYVAGFNVALMVGAWSGSWVLTHSGGKVLWGACLVLGLGSAVGMLRVPISKRGTT